MTDIRARLADALHDIIDEYRSCNITVGDGVSVLLRTPGIAIVDAELASDASVAIADWINGAPCDDPAYARSMVDQLADAGAVQAQEEQP